MSSKPKKSLWSFTKDPVVKLKIEQGLNKARKALGSAAIVAKTIHEIGPNPTLKNVILQGTIGLSELVSGRRLDPSLDSAYKLIFLDAFHTYLWGMFQNNPNFELLGTPERPLRIGNIGEEIIVLAGNNQHDDGNFYYRVREGDEEQSKKVLQSFGRIIWETCGSRVSLSGTSTEGDYRLLPWKAPEEFKSSSQTLELKNRIKKFLQSGASRSVLLYGEPGVGKSCMAQTIVGSLGGLTLFIEAVEVDELDSDTLKTCLDMLCPDGVIIDDLDRIPDSSYLLSLIDRVRGSTKVFIVTANNIKKFDAAMKRTGRFDEVVEVIRSVSPRDILSPELPEEVFEEIEDWPISFVQELNLRLNVLGEECLEEELDSLRTRVLENSVVKKDDEDEEDEDD